MKKSIHFLLIKIHLQKIYKLSKIDPWFLNQIKEIVEEENKKISCRYTVCLDDMWGHGYPLLSVVVGRHTGLPFHLYHERGL